MSPADNRSITALLFLSFLYNPLRILPNVGSILASTTPAPVLISGALLLESLVRPKYAGEDNLSDVLSNPLQVLQDVHKRVGVHFKSKFDCQPASCLESWGI